MGMACMKICASVCRVMVRAFWGCKQRNLLCCVDDTTSGRGACKDENSSTIVQRTSIYAHAASSLHSPLWGQVFPGATL